MPDSNDRLPIDEDCLRAELLLAMVPGVGPRIRQSLIDRFGSAQATFAAAPSELRQVSGVGAKLLRAITSAENEIDIDAQLACCRDNGIQIVTGSHPCYPRLLQEIPDPPGILFVHGQIEQHDAISIAIVGTRHSTRYGDHQAEKLAMGLARAGFTIISGLARGIDAAAHRGALAGGGRTLAVLGSGVLNIYPPEHKTLAEQILGNGAVISEHTPNAAPKSGSFPQRNRIVTGMSLGVIVVEAADRSGALISARHAMEQGREVFAVPGRVDQRTSRGCHRLIRDGATLVESVDDVLDALGPLAEAIPQQDGQVVHHPAELLLNEQEMKVLNAIESEPTDIDSIVVRSGLPIHRVLSTISVLEMRHLIQRISGTVVARL